MEIESHHHTAVQICTKSADVETLDTYEARINEYQAKDFTYIPMPKDMKYYDTEEGWLRDLDKGQIIHEDTHLMEVLRKMSNHPFLLVDFGRENQYYDLDLEGETKLINQDMFEHISRRGDAHIAVGPEQTINVGELSDDFENKQPLSVHEVQQKYPDKVGDTIIPYNKQYGMITLVDINSRGIKQMLYKIISQLSSDLATKIESKYPDSEDLFKYMRPITIGRGRKDKVNGLNMHISEHMNLLEMMQAIQASDKDFVNSCGFESKEDVETLNSINDIRNRVMHANRSLIYDRKEIKEVIKVVNDAQGILTDLAD